MSSGYYVELDNQLYSNSYLIMSLF